MTHAPRAIPTPAELEMKQRVRERVMRERRRRLVRNSVFVLAISGLMLYVALAQRDHQARRTHAQEAAKLAQVFQVSMERTGTPSRNFPVQGKDLEYLMSRYALNPLYVQQVQSMRPIGVAVLNEPERMYLQDAGRIVVLFDGEKYFGEWIPEAEFSHRRRNLGF